LSFPPNNTKASHEPNIPTGAYAIGFVTTIPFDILSDRLRSRPPIAILITFINIIRSLVLAIRPSVTGSFCAYFTNAATYAYGPITIAWLNEYFSALPDEHELIPGIAQMMGATLMRVCRC